MVKTKRVLNACGAMAMAMMIMTAVAATERTAAAEVRLANDPALWQRKVFNLGSVPEKDAARFSVGQDGFAVGPWLAGDYGARLEYRKKIPTAKGTILGRYRTEGLLPRQAAVTVQFYAGERSLGKRTIGLAATTASAELAVPVLHPPAGADGITVGFGLFDEHTEGRVYFSDLRVSDQVEKLNYSAQPALTRPAPPQKLAPAPRVRLEQAGGAWWLVGTDGRPFFALGSTLPSGKREGKDTAPEAAVFAEMQRLGLNCTAGSHDVKRWAAFNKAQAKAGRPTALQFYTLETRVNDGYDTLVNAAGNNPGNSQAAAAAVGAFNHAFPDPFDPKWAAALRKRVHDTAGLVRGKPYYGGWFADNERAHQEIHRYVWSKHCAAELRKFLEKKYGRIEALNKAWGSSFASFEELVSRKPDPAVRRGAMYEDFRLFSREIIRQFNRTVLAVIHEEDPGCLVFSNRFMLGEVRDMLDNLDLYRDFDAIAVNIYPANLAAGLDPAERQILELIHQRTGKPILISEWSVPALDSGLYNNPKRQDWSYAQAVATQAQRAGQARQILADFYNMPFVIGAHWFAWNDFDSAKRQANRGLFKADGQPWPELQEALCVMDQELSRRANPAGKD